MFSILLVLTKKRYSSFLTTVFVFQKIWIKVNVWKTFKTFTKCHRKICLSLKGRANLKTPTTFFRGIYAVSVKFKIKNLRKYAFPNIKTSGGKWNNFVNIWKTSEAANLVFQWIFLLNSLKHKIFPVSIVKMKVLFEK